MWAHENLYCSRAIEIRCSTRARYRSLLLVMLAGCRFGFEEHHDAAPPMDASPLALACNTPVRLGDGSGYALAATSTATRVLATWGDGSVVRLAGAVITTEGALPFGLDAVPATAAHLGLAADASGNDVLHGVTPEAGVTTLTRLDDATLTAAVAVSMTVQLTGEQGIVATGIAEPAWVLDGNDALSPREAALGLSHDLGIVASLDSGMYSSRTTLVPFGSRIAVIDSTTDTSCDVKTMNAALTSITASVPWGTAGQCTEANGAFIAGRKDALLVRHDTVDADLNHVIGAINANGTLMVPGEKKLSGVADEPRAIGLSDGYLVLYASDGMLDVVTVDVAANVGIPIALGPVPSASAHALVVHAGEPYAIWLGEGLELARICP
jgi:hypothetical protein